MRKAGSMRTNIKKLKQNCGLCCGFTERERETSLARREVVDEMALSLQLIHEISNAPSVITTAGQ